MIDRFTRPPALLVYHGIGQAERDPARLLTPPEQLEAHVRLLRRRNYEFLTAEELVTDSAPRPGTAVLTFDDGWANWSSAAVPLLESLGVRGTFFVCPGLWGQQHPDVEGPEGRLLERESAGALAAAGMELGSHTLTHPDLRKLGDEELGQELSASKAAVEELTGRPCRTLAYPYGLYDDRVAGAAEAAGYELAFAWLPGPWRRFAAPRLPAPPRGGAVVLSLKLAGIRRKVR
jgi:peptidoglycan/xylan/chitin deacetylase (PgdA/CDA1 family)